MCVPTLMEVSLKVYISVGRLYTMCSCALCIYLLVRDHEHVCICLHYNAYQAESGSEWVCSSNQASFSVADISFTLSVWSRLLHEQPIYYGCLATGSSLGTFRPLSEITTKTLSLLNQTGTAFQSPDTTPSLSFYLFEMVYFSRDRFFL